MDTNGTMQANNKLEVSRILSEVQTTSYHDIQSAEKLLEYGFKLIQYIAFTGAKVSEAKELLHNARKQAYINLVASLGAHEKKIGVMLMKDYCNDVCAKENAYLTLCERANATCTHANSLIITAISYLKTELQNLSYSNR